MYMGWGRLFQIQEIVYMELVIEFLATVSFRRKIMHLMKRTLVINLVGKGALLALLISH